MASREEFVAAVDAFLGSSKELVGIDVPVNWLPGRDPAEQTVRIPIQIDGVQYGQSLVVVYRPASEWLDFSILLVMNVCVSRLDFDESGGHTNSLIHSDNLPYIVAGSHFHRWTYNKRFVQSDAQLLRLENAEELPDGVRTFETALRWFCDETNIQLPHGHQIFSPDPLLI